MPRESTRHIRQRIAQAAARLMAEHGIRDHALAKRKAARQLGVADASGLPGNDEIDAELRAYEALFAPDDQARELSELRHQALAVMASLARFHPVLTGSLAQGLVLRHADIELEVYADSSKEFEQFLLNQDIGFKSEERRGGSYFTLYSDPADVCVHVLPEQSQPSAPRGGQEVRRRLSAAQLRQILVDAAPKNVGLPPTEDHNSYDSADEQTGSGG